MATWDRNRVWIELVLSTGASDTSTHTVQFQPTDQAFSTGAVAASVGASNSSRYRPVSDLDTTKCYDIHLSSATTPIDRIYGPDTITLVSEE